MNNTEIKLQISEATIKELKQYVNALLQLVAGYLPICPTKRRKLIKIAITNGEILREQCQQQMFNALADDIDKFVGNTLSCECKGQLKFFIKTWKPNHKEKHK